MIIWSNNHHCTQHKLNGSNKTLKDNFTEKRTDPVFMLYTHPRVVSWSPPNISGASKGNSNAAFSWTTESFIL